MTSGDKIIYETDYGYEIGWFVEQGRRNLTTVEICSGSLYGNHLELPTCDIKSYSKELIKELTDKFGVVKDWSDIF